MNVNLETEALYEQELLKAAKQHGQVMNMESKREFDRAATYFKRHSRNLSPKIDDAYDRQKDITFVIGADTYINKVVSSFKDETFSNMNDLKKIVNKRFEEVEKLISSKDKKIKIRILGTTVNICKEDNFTKNEYVVCGEFISNVRVYNFCLIK